VQKQLKKLLKEVNLDNLTLKLREEIKKKLAAKKIEKNY